MKSIKKGLLTLGCAALLVSASVMGTMAYLTSSDTVTNTFTVGKVAITLDEAKVNAAGQPINKEAEVVTNLAAAERVDGNSYKLMPGHKYTKDPTLTVQAGSEESYVRLLVTATFDEQLTDAKLATKLGDIFTGYSSDWNRPDDPEVETKYKTDYDDEGQEKSVPYTVVTYEYRYNTTVDGVNEAGENADDKLPALFTKVEIPGNWTNDDLKAIGGVKIEVVGQAIQADGFATADAAWKAFEE